jgi:uncharacterized protein
MTPTKRVLVIMAKAARPGSVKTRLYESFSPEAVTELYECLLRDTVALAQKLVDVELAIVSPALDVEDLSRTLDGTLRIMPQMGDGLAAGLSSVFNKFAARRDTRVIAFNSDSPHLPASVLENAFHALETHDLVVGPTYDGGYFLVGASASHPNLFIGDCMGTASALDALLSRARVLRLSVHLTDPFYDIDVPADLSRLATELQPMPEKAPRTAKWLSEKLRVRAANTGSN